MTNFSLSGIRVPETLVSDFPKCTQVAGLDSVYLWESNHRSTIDSKAAPGFSRDYGKRSRTMLSRIHVGERLSQMSALERHSNDTRGQTADRVNPIPCVARAAGLLKSWEQNHGRPGCLICYQSPGCCGIGSTRLIWTALARKQGGRARGCKRMLL